MFGDVGRPANGRQNQGFVPRVYEIGSGDKVIKVTSDPNKHCRNCNLRGHDYLTCFRYPNPPTNVQCKSCHGYHEGECKRFTPVGSNFGGNVRNDRPNFKDARFPMNMGLANRGRQALPAEMAGIQNKNFGPNGTRPEGDAKVVYVQVARSDIVGDFGGSGYHCSIGDPMDQIAEEYDLSQVTEEELAQIQEAEAILLEEESSQGSHIIHQQDDEEQ
jgi:hypothetical protein